MKLHTLMASAAALAFATGAIAQQAGSPASPEQTTTEAGATAAGSADTTATDAAASTGAAASVAPSGSATSDQAAITATDQAATAATAPATDAASATAAPTPQPGVTDSQTASAADPAKVQAADQMIAQNWSKYDSANKGQLTPLEFGSWVLAAQGNDMTAQVEKSRQSKASNLPSTKVLNATSAEFSKADANKDRMISQDELRSYLSA